MVSSFQCGMPVDFTDFIHTAGKHRIGQFTAFEAVHPTLHCLDRTFHRFRLILCRCRQQVGFRKAIIRSKQRVGTIQHGLELTADAVIVDRRCEHQHICVVHFVGDLHGIILDDAVPQLQAGKTTLAKANLLFPQRYGFNLIACLPCTLGKCCRQRFGVAALAGA